MKFRPVTVDGRAYWATLRVDFDGIEHIGRLWFVDALDSQLALVDHGAVPGATSQTRPRFF
ncbi:MAG: hypothetical protein NVSMB53_05790 [Gemmatimonadaceae bacterium]